MPTAEAKVKGLLDAVQKALGITPNLFRVAAQSPAALEGLLGLNGALGHGLLRPRLRESIALAVAQANGCDYCLSAHTALGRGAGLNDSDLALARKATASDARSAAAPVFARALVDARGKVNDADVAAVKLAGFSDGEIVEIVAHVALNILTNYLNIAAATEIDFPVVRASEAA